MEFKGTKGEWQYINRSSVSGKTDYLGFKIGNEEFRFSEIRHFDSEKDTVFSEEEISNAKLIAAAPDLLEALLSIKSSIDSEEIVIYDNLDHDGFASTPQKLYDKIDKAITKALKE